MKTECVGCRGEISLPFAFKMAFQPIVDVVNNRVWGYEALVRGENGEPASSVLTQLTDQTRYQFD
jgi:EAL domain-containing protein (putative c-di-GMP-specific phosphodiesterase class I)